VSQTPPQQRLNQDLGLGGKLSERSHARLLNRDGSFSVQTPATIGYGKPVPATRAANVLVAIEAPVGLLGFAILSALPFARFARPTSRIRFSSRALIAPYQGGWALMFRLANMRNHDLTDVHAVVWLARWNEENGTRRRRFDQLALERDFIIFMPLPWVVVHPITEASPLRGLTAESLAASDPEVVCLITADDETFAQTVHARTSCDKGDIVWGARFNDMYVAHADRVTIDLGRLDDTEPVAPPASL
jgi:inward rectifier potassium channel